MDDWRVLDLADDPTPGAPDQVRALTAQLRRQAEQVGQHTARLRAVAATRGELRLQGDYSAPFLAGLDRLPAEAARLGTAYQVCAEALSAFADGLEQAQAVARSALNQGVQADAQYQGLLRQFYSLVPVQPPSGGVWRGLDEAWAVRLSLGLPEPVRQQAVFVGYYARMCEAQRQQARGQAVQAAEAHAAAVTRCAQSVAAAAPRTDAGTGRRPAAAGGGDPVAATVPIPGTHVPRVRAAGEPQPPSTTAQRPDVVAFDAGSRGSWSREANRPLKPNTTYVERDTGYTYNTDARGRVSSFSGTLQRGPGHRNAYQQAKSGRSDRRANDQGGHLFAHIFRGPGERINLVPMDSNLNLSAWKRMENGWDRALGADSVVRVHGTVVYDPTSTSTRPTRFTIREMIDDGPPRVHTFRNR